jgi:hypothetical protein
MAIASFFAQEGLPPDFLRSRALVVRFLAIASELRDSSRRGADAYGQPTGSARPRGPAWTSRSLRYTVSGSPIGIRLASEDLLIIVQVTPYDHGKEGLVIVAQGQVWVKQENGEIAYHTAFETLSVDFGERVFFYPLGLNPDGSSAFHLEIAVDRFGDKPSIAESDSSESASQQPQSPGGGNGGTGSEAPVKPRP